MRHPPLTSQVQQVGKLEIELSAARKKAAAAIREVREKCGLSLAQVQPLVGLTPTALSNLERGQSWATATAERVARVLDERCTA